MFCDPFLIENVSVSGIDKIINEVELINIESNFYGTGYSSVDLSTPQIIETIFQKFLEDKASALFNTKLNLKKIWVNINPPGAYQSRHTHAEFPVAGTYYLKVPNNSGNIIFYHPSPHVETLQRLKPFYSFTHTHIPNQNDLLIWPGYMDHEVSYNYSAENRITISFCLDL